MASTSICIYGAGALGGAIAVKIASRLGDNATVDHRSLVRLSKRMSLALRHTPDRFGLVERMW